MMRWWQKARKGGAIDGQVLARSTRRTSRQVTVLRFRGWTARTNIHFGHACHRTRVRLKKECRAGGRFILWISPSVPSALERHGARKEGPKDSWNRSAKQKKKGFTKVHHEHDWCEDIDAEL